MGGVNFLDKLLGLTTTVRAKFRMGKALRDGYREEGICDDQD